MFRKLTILCFVLSFFNLGVGAYAHLSYENLGCPDWPTCYGQWTVSSVVDLESKAKAFAHEKAFNLEKTLAEIGYRHLVLAQAFLLVLMALLAAWQPANRLSVLARCLLLLVLIGLQLGCNRWVITSMADPVAITVLSLLEMMVFWLLFELYLQGPRAVRVSLAETGSKPLRIVNNLVMLLVCLHVAYATWLLVYSVNAEYHGMAWQQTRVYIGQTAIVFDNDTLRQWLYLSSAAGSFMFLIVLGFITIKQRPMARGLALTAFLSFLALLALEVYGYLLDFPLWMVIAHSLTGALLMLPLLALSRYARFEYDLPLPGIAPERAPLPRGPEKPVAEINLAAKPESLYARLTLQLQRTRTGLSGLLGNLSLGQKRIDRDCLEELETNLLMADVGINVTQQIIGQLTESLERRQLNDPETLTAVLRQSLLQVLEPCSQNLAIPKQDKPFVILVVGINGAGKTTTIGKLAKKLQTQGHSVLLAAGDTFRAAAVEQLQTWGERNGIAVIAQHSGADSASVIYDALQSAQAKKMDVLIADTAGRLHTKSNLMDELKKVKRIMGKLDDTAPHEVLLVLDAGTGQNALSQARLFNEAVGVTGLALTKLDGTAKGGVIFALSQQLGIPVRFIGIGEGIDDLQDFHAGTFVDALLARD